MRKLSFSFLLVFVLFGPGLVASDEAGALSTMEQSFRKTATTHIEAIKNRDLERLLSTVTRGEELTLIFPGGTTLYTRQEYVDFHTGWFEDESWTMEIEPVSYTVRGNYGVVLVRTTYTDDAGSRQAMLAMSFTLEDGDWRLIFDQNTRIVDD